MAFAQIHALDFTEEDRVVSGWIFRDDIAGEMGQSAIKDGDARFGPTIADAESGVGLRALFARGKMLRERLLGIVQNAYAEAPLDLEEREQAAFLVDTDGDQKWLEGNRCKRVGGHAVDLTGLAFDSDHGYPGGKVSHDAAE